MLSLEKVGDCANLSAEWMGRMSTRYSEDVKILAAHDSKRSEGGEMIVTSKEWLEAVRKQVELKRTIAQEKL